MNLKYCYLTAEANKETRNAVVVMGFLGIKYRFSMQRARTHEWVFYNCTNVPDNLPPYLSKMEEQNG